MYCGGLVHSVRHNPQNTGYKWRITGFGSAGTGSAARGYAGSQLLNIGNGFGLCNVKINPMDSLVTKCFLKRLYVENERFDWVITLNSLRYFMSWSFNGRFSMERIQVSLVMDGTG